MDPQVLSVSQFLGIINETLAFAYPQVVIEGEVSSFKISQGKFAFFDLKDDKGVLNCFMMARDLKVPIEDGMKVRASGVPKVFPKSSRFSLTVRDVEPAGEGQLRRALELLKKKLESEGLFDPSRKRPLPAFPQRIGLITSGTSAAYGDFMKILSARWGGVEVLLADVAVQGNTAPDQVVGAVEYFNHLTPPADVVVLIRGGGSLEDLMAFSTEPVARAVAASRTPIIVGVGHEQDVSLADFAADVRAATPTDAARIVVPDRAEVAARITHLAARQEAALTGITSAYHRRTDLALGRLEAGLRQPREQVTALGDRLWRGFERMSGTVAVKRAQTEALERILRGFDPRAVLRRGYAIARDNSGHILRDPATVKTGDTINVQLAGGTLDAQIR